MNDLFFSLLFFFSSILEIDFAVGEIMKKLEKNEMDDDTLIYFTSDHGSHIDLGTDGGSNGNFKGICSKEFFSYVSILYFFHGKIVFT